MKKASVFNLALFSGTHALVDASCAALLFGMYKAGNMETGRFAFLLLLYNVLAFALQAPLGFLADRLRRSHESSASGCLFLTAALLASDHPMIAVCLAGLGNALFHVGGGIVSLKIRPGKASIPGMFVAPGALGLFAGTLIGNRGFFDPWPFILLLILCAWAILSVGRSEALLLREGGVKAAAGNIKYLEPIILLMAAAIALRALTGFAVDFPWKTDIFLLTVLTLAIVLGKGLGGLLADRFGWTFITVSGLLLSAPLLLLGFGHPYLGILGLFLFNMTMPVTLVTISNVLPGMEGFAFGLSTLAIISGSFPMFTGLKYVFYNKGVILAAVLVCAGLVYFGLRLYFKASGRAGRPD